MEELERRRIASSRPRIAGARSLAVGLFLGLLLAFSSGAGAQGPANDSDPGAWEDTSWFVATGGIFDTNNNESEVYEFGLEYRGRPRKWGLAGTGGAAVTSDSSYWGWAGLRRDFPLGEKRRTWFGIAFGVSLYEQGDGKDLGGAVEFRSSGELTFRISPKARLGLNLYHLSNAGIYDLNPGANSLVLVAAFGL